MLHNYRTLQITPLVLSDLPDAATPIDLPMCELSRLFEIREVIEGAMSSPIRRERLAIALQSESYIPVRELEIIPFSIIDHCLLLPYPGLSSLSMLTLWASVLILTFPQQLVEIFHVCEDLENTEDLHRLFDIFKSIFLLNKNSIFEIMFTGDLIFEVRLFPSG